MSDYEYKAEPSCIAGDVPSSTGESAIHCALSEGAKARILFIERNFDGTVGGSHRVLLEVLRHMDRRRFEPVVLFYEKHALVPEFCKFARVLFFTSRGLRIDTDFPALYCWGRKVPLLLRLLSALQKMYNFSRYAVPEFLAIIGMLMRERIDLVCINNSPFLTEWLLASRILGRHCVSYFRGTPLLISKWKGRLFGFYGAILSISEAVTENARRQGAVVDRFTLVYDGIDAEAVRRQISKQPEQVRQEWRIDSGRPLIGLVNNFKQWKGQHIVVEAMRILLTRRQDVMCLLIGDVAESDRGYAETLRKRVEAHGLSGHVIFTGRRDDVPNLLGALDVVLHASLSNEGFPRVILEAMVLGRPIIASRSGPNVEMIEDGISGFVVQPGHPDALAERIEEVLANSELSAAVGKRAQDRAERLFNIETNMRKTEEVFSCLLR
mgnify:CR=1 FL=1